VIHYACLSVLHAPMLDDGMQLLGIIFRNPK
jgi:hypothetical protein